MKKSLSFLAIGFCCMSLSGCVVSERPVAYGPRAVGPEPVLVYPAEPLVGETVVIDGLPFYRHYYNGRPYYHHRR